MLQAIARKFDSAQRRLRQGIAQKYGNAEATDDHEVRTPVTARFHSNTL